MEEKSPGQLCCIDLLCVLRNVYQLLVDYFKYFLSPFIMSRIIPICFQKLYTFSFNISPCTGKSFISPTQSGRPTQKEIQGKTLVLNGVRGHKGNVAPVPALHPVLLKWTRASALTHPWSFESRLLEFFVYSGY